MSKLLWLPFLLVLVFSTSLYAKDKDSSLERAVEDVFGDHGRPGKGEGRPNNPGDHGRDNAAENQSRGHGNSSKEEDSWEDKIRDEFEDDDVVDKGKNKNKNH